MMTVQQLIHRLHSLSSDTLVVVYDTHGDLVDPTPETTWVAVEGEQVLWAWFDPQDKDRPERAKRHAVHL